MLGILRRLATQADADTKLVDDEDFISKKTLETLTDNGCLCIGASDVKATVELVSTAAAVIFIVFDLNTPKKNRFRLNQGG